MWGRSLPVPPLKYCGLLSTDLFPSPSRNSVDHSLSPNAASVRILSECYYHDVLYLPSENSRSVNHHRRISHTIQTHLTGVMMASVNQWWITLGCPRKWCMTDYRRECLIMNFGILSMSKKGSEERLTTVHFSTQNQRLYRSYRESMYYSLSVSHLRKPTHRVH
jgi:hypothetical protein